MKKVFIALALFSLLVMMDSCSNIRANRNSIQYCDIEQIYIGMPLDSVVQLLGQPYTFNSDLGCHDLTCEHPRVVSDIKMRKETDIIRSFCFIPFPVSVRDKNTLRCVKI